MGSDEEGGNEGSQSAIDVGGKVAVETMKATQEVAKLGTKALSLVKQAGTYFASHFDPVIVEIVQGLTDKAAYWRFKNLVSVLDKAQKLVDERELPPDVLKSLPFGEALRFARGASEEEEETVQDLWARLLANAFDPTTGISIKKVYVDLLKSLSPPEAVLLDFLAESQPKTPRTINEVPAFHAKMNALAERGWRRFDESERRAAVQNLIRIRCIAFRPARIDLSGLAVPLDRSPSWRGPAGINPDKLHRIIEELGQRILINAGIAEPLPTHSAGRVISFPREIPEMAYMLTALGHDLVEACRQKEDPGSSAASTPD